jgi:molybdopterin converting factor small subunit
MVVTVTLPAIFQSPNLSGNRPQQSPGRQFDVTLLSGSTLAELIPDLGVELSLEKTVLEVNGRPTGLNTVLHDGDQVKLIPANSDPQSG